MTGVSNTLVRESISHNYSTSVVYKYVRGRGSCQMNNRWNHVHHTGVSVNITASSPETEADKDDPDATVPLSECAHRSLTL